MEQKIFNLGLSVDGTSLYLILAALQSEAAALNLENVSSRWLSSQEKLEASIAELEAHQVIAKMGDKFILKTVDEWKEAVSS